MVKEMRESLRGTSWEGQGEGVVDSEGGEEEGREVRESWIVRGVRGKGEG